MRHIVVSLAAVAIFATGIATAQLKPIPGTPGRPMTPLNPNPAVQITPINPADQSNDLARRITREEAIKLVRQRKAVYVDVRPKESYDSEHIKGAINIPLPDLMKRMRELPPKQFLITYCA